MMGAVDGSGSKTYKMRGSSMMVLNLSESATRELIS